jgi:tripartite-type tricarboxylate transporter receptor subunit TctC
VVDKLRRETAAILENPDTQKRLIADAAEPRTLPPADIRKMIRAEVAKWNEVARVAGIRVQSPVTASR